jgi:hypothetical protein
MGAVWSKRKNIAFSLTKNASINMKKLFSAHFKVLYTFGEQETLFHFQNFEIRNFEDISHTKLEQNGLLYRRNISPKNFDRKAI